MGVFGGEVNDVADGLQNVWQVYGKCMANCTAAGDAKDSSLGCERDDPVTVLWTVTRPDCPKPQGEGQGAISVPGRLEIGARLPGRAR